MTITELYKEYSKHRIITTDTRNIPQNSIFFALKGERFNGNKFAKEAIQKGAMLAIVDEEEYANQEQHIHHVPNTLKALQALANHHRKQLTIPVIALTGSNGKTTSKELINSVLSVKFNVCFTKGNLNNHIGVPLTLLSILPEHQLAIIEMGANHQKEIELLSAIAMPDIGYITNFGKAHLEGFGGIEGVIKGKSELYDFLRNNNKKVLLNAEDQKQTEKANGIKAISFGVNKGEVLFDLVNQHAATVAVRVNGITIESNLTGNYNFTNICAAIRLGLHFGLELQEIKKGIEAYLPTNNRSQILNIKNKTIILDAYNANPSSMEAALNNLSKFTGTKTAILGDMFELGSESLQEHNNILQLAQSLDICTIAIGNAFYDCKTDNNKTQLFNHKQEAEDYIKNHWQITDVVLIKASRGMRFETISELIQNMVQ